MSIDWDVILKRWHIILSILVILGTGAYWLEHRWNQSQAVAENRFCAASNKEMYLKMALDQICQRYGYNAYPCPTSKMMEVDQLNYRQYEEWYRQEQQRIRKMFGG